MDCLPIDDQCRIEHTYQRFIIENKAAGELNAVQFTAPDGRLFTMIRNPYNGRFVIFVKDRVGEYLQDDGNYFAWNH